MEGVLDKHHKDGGIIIVTGVGEPDQYRRLERQLQDAATQIRLNDWRDCDLKVRYDMNGMVAVEVEMKDTAPGTTYECKS